MSDLNTPSPESPEAKIARLEETMAVERAARENERVAREVLERENARLRSELEVWKLRDKLMETLTLEEQQPEELARGMSSTMDEVQSFIMSDLNTPSPESPQAKIARLEETVAVERAARENERVARENERVAREKERVAREVLERENARLRSELEVWKLRDKLMETLTLEEQQPEELARGMSSTMDEVQSFVRLSSDTGNSFDLDQKMNSF